MMDIGHIDSAMLALLAPSDQRKEPARSEAPAPKAPSAPATSNYGFALRVDEHTHEVIAVITDPQTRAVIREIPAEEMRTASNVIRNLIGRLTDRLA